MGIAVFFLEESFVQTEPDDSYFLTRHIEDSLPEDLSIADLVLYQRSGICNVAMLKFAKPLRLFANKNFFLRVPNKEFALNNFNVCEQHFTVMNYSDDTPFYHVKYAEFTVEREK